MNKTQYIEQITGIPTRKLADANAKPVDVNINNISNVDKVDKVPLGATPVGEPQAIRLEPVSSSLESATPSPSAQEDSFGGDCFSQEGVSRGAPPETETTQMLALHNQIKRAVVTLWQRPEKRTKYTVTITFTLTTGEQVQFNASMTNDIGNFQKYLPYESSDYIWEKLVKPYHKECLSHKQPHYMGKFWHNDRTAGGKPIEPYTGATLHFDNESKAWRVRIRFHDWEDIFLLSTNRLTEAQKKSGVHAMAIWNKPITRQSWSQRQQASQHNVASIKGRKQK